MEMDFTYAVETHHFRGGYKAVIVNTFQDEIVTTLAGLWKTWQAARDAGLEYIEYLKKIS